MNPDLEHMAGGRDGSLAEQKAACLRQFLPMMDCLLDAGISPEAIIAAFAHLSMLAAGRGQPL